MRFLALVLALTATGAPAWAQTPATTEATNAGVLQRCFELQRSEPDTSITLAETLLKSAELTADAQLRALICLGGAQATIGNPVAANRVINPALDLIEQLPVGQRMQGYAGVAGILLAIGQGHRATAVMEQAYKLVHGTDDAESRLIALDLMGQIRASEFNDHVGAESYFLEAIAVAKSLGNELPYREYNYGLSLIEMGRLDEAEKAFDSAAAKAEKSGKWELISHRIRANRSDILIARKQYDRAHAQLLEAIAGQHRLRDVQGEVASRTRLGIVQLATGDSGAALESAQEAVRLSEQGKFLREQLEAMRLLVSVHAARGEPDKALAAAQDLHALEVKRLTEQNLRSMAGLQAQVQDEGTARENERLHYESERAGLVRNLALAMLLVVALSGAAVTWFQRRVQRRLRRLGAVDPLTGLLNRREAARRLAAMPIGVERNVLLLIDVDHFKSVNDQHGHGVGDLVLVKLAELLQGACRPHDVVARWGGEEFLVACPEMSREQAERFAERLRSLIADAPIPLRDGGMLDARVSIGFAPFAFFPGRTDGNWNDAVRLADRALYAAKRAGRNAWAGIWGAAEAGDVGLGRIEGNLLRAQDAGWIDLLGSRPVNWSAVTPATNRLDGADRGLPGDAAPDLAIG